MKRNRGDSNGYEYSKRNKIDESTDTLDNIKIHPLLMSGNDNEEVKKVVTPVVGHWKQREGFVINPYIDQSDISLVPTRKKTLSLKMNEPGKYIERGKLMREKIRKERIEQAKAEELKRLNLIPDKALGEDKYGDEFKDPPPYVEWWDLPYLKNGDRRGCKYDGISENIVSYRDEESEDNPITSFIQHPVPIESPWTRLIPKPKPLYLTKKEQKRLRKNRRMIAMQEKQDKIKLGLAPVPASKVKLKNLMNVLTNETIRNPTEVEMRVRGEIQEREDEHNRMNEERKLNKEDKKEKIERKNEEDKGRGIFRCVFGINRLINPKNVYKVDMNAKQLMVTGVCLSLRGGKSIVIVEGGYKSVEKYKKLMMRRIDWTTNELPREFQVGDGVELEDLSGNRCELLWEGEIREEKFRKWSQYEYDQDEDVDQFLTKFGMENYWRQVGLGM